MKALQKQQVLKKILPNGLSILFYRVPTAAKVAVQLWYNVGSKHEKNGEKGLAHFLEHMLFKGTDLLSESDINLIAHKLSGYCNAFTSHDYTCYVFDMPRQHWHHTLFILAECMMNCTFDQKMLNSELKAVIQELKMYKDDYGASLLEELMTLVFSQHPYHYPIIGFKHHLWAINREQIRAFYKQHYVPNNATLVVVGDIDPEEVFAQAEQSFGLLVPSVTVPLAPEVPPQISIEQRSVTLYRQVSQPFLVCALVVPGKKAGLSFYLQGIARILGGSKASVLYVLLVEQLDLATDVQAFCDDMFDYGLLYVYVQPKQGVDHQNINAEIARAIDRIVKEGFSDDAVKHAFKHVEVDHITRFEHVSDIAEYIGSAFLAIGDSQALFSYIDHDFASIKRHVHELVQRYVRSVVMHSGAVVPLRQEDKAQWELLQDLSDEEDEQGLAEKQRETSVEPGSYVHTITSEKALSLGMPVYTTHECSNGMQLYVCDNAIVDKIEIVLELATNHYYDPEDKQGLYSLLCALLEEGTQSYPGVSFAQELDKHGITLEVAPGYISMSLLRVDFRKALELLAELLYRPTLLVKDFDKVKEQMKAILTQYWDTPSDFVQQLARDAVYKKHPYHKAELGTHAGLRHITYDDMHQWFKKVCTPSGAALVVAGNVSGYDVVGLVHEYLDQWKGPEALQMSWPAIVPVQRQVINHPLQRDQVVLCFAGLSVARMDSDYDKLLLFDQIFGGGVLNSMSSKLFQLREQSGLFYTITGSLTVGAGRQPGMVMVKTVVSTDMLCQAEDKITELIDTVWQTVSDQEFRDAQNALVNSLPDMIQTNRARAATILFLRKYRLNDSYFTNRADTLYSLKFDEVKDAVLKILSNDRLVTLRVGRVHSKR